MPVDILIGGQYGSEGKGVIASFIAHEYQAHVRTGSPNAGHSLCWNDKVYKMQQIPCGWINPEARLFIGRGALINPDILKRELEMIPEGMEVRNRLFIDPLAGVLDPRFAEMEGHTKGAIHARIGSTGEGVGAARMARVSRNDEDFYLARDCDACKPFLMEDTPGVLSRMVFRGQNILLEGTQGYGLSLIHGQWPYVTSTDTNAAQLMADAGLSPRMVERIIMVIRTFPIRVAGNSGPLKYETTWADLGLPEEKTTVTKLVRRVGHFDMDQVVNAAILNQPTHIALNFADYLCQDDAGCCYYDDLEERTKMFIEKLETRLNTPVAFIGTGRKEDSKYWEVIDRRKFQNEDA